MLFNTISPCKLNLFLYINNKRPDGYHDLQTLFVILNHGDKMHFEITNDGKIDLLTDFGFPKEQNLIYKAALLLKEQYNQNLGVKISIDKVLPQGGGLGGGSSNAATVLLVLNKLWNLNLDEKTLIKLGAKLGADVPIFVKGCTSFGQGIGEILDKVDYKNYYYLVATPNCSVPTKVLFSSDKLIFKDKKSYQELLNEEFNNSFTPVVVKEYPLVQDLLDRLSKYGKAYMSGSGSSCFVAFENESDAMIAKKEIDELGISNFIAKSVDISPVIEDLEKY